MVQLIFTCRHRLAAHLMENDSACRDKKVNLRGVVACIPKHTCINDLARERLEKHILLTCSVELWVSRYPNIADIPRRFMRPNIIQSSKSRPSTPRFK